MINVQFFNSTLTLALPDELTLDIHQAKIVAVKLYMEYYDLDGAAAIKQQRKRSSGREQLQVMSRSENKNE